jgi:transposase
MDNLTTIGLDISKQAFHAVRLDETNTVDLRRKFRRAQLGAFFEKLDGCTVVMEACGSAHYWARKFEAMGHVVKLLPAQHVKGYLRGQKNDFNDALAIAEASIHGSIRPVMIKTVEQQDEQARHRMRSLLIRDRVALSNHIRSFLYERGIVFALGISNIDKQVPGILEDAENGLTETSRELLDRLYRQFKVLSDEVRWFTQTIEKRAKEDEVTTRLMELPGVGPIVSSALKSWMGDGKQFKKGRDASAALGVVPRQNSTGGKIRLLGITKKGDTYVRSLVIHGARAALMRAANKNDPLSLWVNRIKERRGYNKATVALANKLIRMAWVIVARGEHYRPQAIEV